MKQIRLFLLLPLLVFCAPLFAANPSYKNFDTNYFMLAPDGSTITLIPGIFQGSTSGIPVLNGVGTNTTIRGGTVSANLAGSTNLYNVPQTLYIRTNGNNATAIRGDPAAAWSTLLSATVTAQSGDTLQLNGSVYAPGTNYVTNVNLIGAGAWLTLSNSGGMPGILTSNSYLKDLRITNASDADFTAAIGNAKYGDYSQTGSRIFIKDCFVQAPSIAAFFKFGQNTGVQYQATEILDSSFEAFSQAFEVWGAYTKIKNCRFTVLHAHDSTENNALTMTFNDNGTNFLENCLIEALGPTNGGQNVAITLFQGSYDQFDHCTIRVQNSVGGNRNNVTSDSAIHFAEGKVTGRFNDCFFNLAPPGSNSPVLLAYIEQQSETAPTDGYLEFNNCFYTPETNGVIVVNRETNVVVTVRGGNLKRSNFLHPEYVRWINTVVATNLDADFMINTNGALIFDVRNYTFYDSLGFQTILFDDKVLGLGGQLAVDWGNRELDDSLSSPTLSWINRQLISDWRALNNFGVGGRLTNSILSPNSIVAVGADRVMKSALLSGLNFDGTTLTATGGGGGIPGTNSPICYGNQFQTNYSVETTNYFAETNLDGNVVLLSRGVAYATRGFVGASLQLTNGPIWSQASGLSNVISFQAKSNGIMFEVGSSVNPSNILSLTNSLNGLFAHLYAPLDISSFANASRMVFEDSTKTLVSASASGAVPIDADGTATTTSQLKALGVAGTNDNRAMTWTAPSNYFGGDLGIAGNVYVGGNGGVSTNLNVAGNIFGFSGTFTNGLTNFGPSQLTGNVNMSGTLTVAGSAFLTGNVFETNVAVIVNRQMGQTNLATPVIDFSVGNYQFMITNNNFTITGFKGYTNGYVSWVGLTYSNLDSASHTLAWPAGLIQFGTNTGTSVTVPSAKVWKGTIIYDGGTNLYGALQSN